MYWHTQTARLILAIIILIAVAMVVSALFYPNPALILTAVFLFVLIVLFSSLTVTADEHALMLYFGPGVIRRSFKYSDIESISRVKNRWYWGWGIRWFGRGWLYNVSGLDAVELKLKTGKLVRIGTDEPDQLARFVGERLKAKS